MTARTRTACRRLETTRDIGREATARSEPPDTGLIQDHERRASLTVNPFTTWTTSDAFIPTSAGIAHKGHLADLCRRGRPPSSVTLGDGRFGLGMRYLPICSPTRSLRQLTRAVPNRMFCTHPTALPTHGSADERVIRFLGRRESRERAELVRPGSGGPGPCHRQ